MPIEDTRRFDSANRQRETPLRGGTAAEKLPYLTGGGVNKVFTVMTSNGENK